MSVRCQVLQVFWGGGIIILCTFAKGTKILSASDLNENRRSDVNIVLTPPPRLFIWITPPHLRALFHKFCVT